MENRKISVIFFILFILLFVLGIIWSMGPGSPVIGIGATMLGLIFFLLGVFKAAQEQEEAAKAEESKLEENGEKL